MDRTEYFSKPLQSVKATAQLLDMNLNGTYTAVRNGQLPSLRLGRKIMIPTAKIKALLGADEAGDRNDQS